MIQLYHALEAVSANPPLRGIRRVVFKRIADVPLLLDGSMSFSNLRPDAPAFVPKPRVADTAPLEDETDQVPEEPEADTSASGALNATATVEPIAVAELPESNLPPSEEQIKAASFLQAMYRRRQRRKTKTNKAPLHVWLKRCFKQCLTESSKMEWPQRSHYRFMFLGPLPHVLACINTAHSWVMDNKQRNKDKFKTALHQDLEEVAKRLTEQRYHKFLLLTEKFFISLCRKIVKEIQSIQKALEPQAPVHRKRDIEELKKLVRQVEEMLGRVAPSVARDVAEDMQIGMKGIVKVKQLPKPKPKPMLNVNEDDDGTGYDDVDYEVAEDQYEPENGVGQASDELKVNSEQVIKDAPSANHSISNAAVAPDQPKRTEIRDSRADHDDIYAGEQKEAAVHTKDGVEDERGSGGDESFERQQPQRDGGEEENSDQSSGQSQYDSFDVSEEDEAESPIQPHWMPVARVRLRAKGEEESDEPSASEDESEVDEMVMETVNWMSI